MKVNGHTQDPAIGCPKCKNEFFMSGIVSHFDKCNKPKKQVGNTPSECPWCDKVLSQSALQSHMILKHQWGAFRCLECSHKANFAEDLVEHMVQESHADAPYIICPSCDNTYPMMDVETHYGVCLASIPRRRVQKFKPFKCATCGKVVDKRKYKEHLRTHLRAQGLTEEEAKMSLYHYCDKCDKRFTQKYALTDHIRSEHSNIKLECPMCNLTFQKRTEWTKHKIIAHSTDARYACQFCDKRFGSESDRMSHEKVHKEPEFQCHICSKLLKSKEALDAHEKMHTGEKPFTCSICDAGFTSKGRLGAHIKGTHKVPGPKGGKAGWPQRTRTKK